MSWCATSCLVRGRAGHHPARPGVVLAEEGQTAPDACRGGAPGGCALVEGGHGPLIMRRSHACDRLPPT
jgi:hypothetical protein